MRSPEYGRCPLCAYETSSTRCPECGEVLSEQFDPDLIRRYPDYEVRQIYLFLIALGGSIAGVVTAPLLTALTLMVGGLLRAAAILTSGAVIGSGVIVLCVLSWFVLAISLPRAAICRRLGGLEPVALLAAAAGTSVVAWLIAAYMEVDSRLWMGLQLLAAALVTRLVWWNVGACWSIWTRTGQFRYFGGLRRRGSTTVLLWLRGLVVVSMLARTLGVAWSGVVDAPSAGARLVVGVADLLAFACGVLALVSVCVLADAIRRERAAQAADLQPPSL